MVFSLENGPCWEFFMNFQRGITFKPKNRVYFLNTNMKPSREKNHPPEFASIFLCL